MKEIILHFLANELKPWIDVSRLSIEKKIELLDLMNDLLRQIFEMSKYGQFEQLDKPIYGFITSVQCWSDTLPGCHQKELLDMCQQCSSKLFKYDRREKQMYTQLAIIRSLRRPKIEA